MNKLYLTLSTILSCAYISSISAADIETSMAHLQAMDKITGRVSEIDVPVNGIANFGTFSILVRKCVTKSAEETPENTAFIDIVDNYQTSNPVNIFKGWMFSSTPALNAVEHPIYDIWLLKCYNISSENKNILNSELLKLRDSIPMIRPQPIETFSELSSNKKDEISNKENHTNSDNVASDNKEKIINVDIPKNDNYELLETQNSNEDDFVSEGEEIIEENTDEVTENKTIEIIITNE